MIYHAATKYYSQKSCHKTGYKTLFYDSSIFIPRNNS